MSAADQIYIDMCNDIIAHGTSTEGEKVRPHWPDGSPAYTVKQFGVVNRYDLRKEFPILTLRRIALKSAVDEVLWIYQQKSNDIHDLHSHIWDEWADENGLIGKAYGYQIAQKNKHHVVALEGVANVADLREQLKDYPSAEIRMSDDGYDVYLDQMDAVLYDLKHNPFSRRIMTNTYNHHDLAQMNLHPCAYSLTFNVTQRPGEDKLTLNAILNQRSNDLLAAGNWNVIQYAALLHMVAQCVDMYVGELVHVIADAHIYDRHLPIVQELVKREAYPAPKFWLNPDVHDFYAFTRDDVKLEGYRYGEDVKDIPIAI